MHPITKDPCQLEVLEETKVLFKFTSNKYYPSFSKHNIFHGYLDISFDMRIRRGNKSRVHSKRYE